MSRSEKEVGGKYDPPKTSIGDVVYATARAGISEIPMVGGPILEFFNLIIAPPLDKRRQKWMESVRDGLLALEERGSLRMEDLKDNEAFGSIVMQASQAAVRTHQQEKIDALRNAVLNAAMPSPADESLQQVFISLIDRFTEWHLRLLLLFADPNAWFESRQRPFPSPMISSLEGMVVAAYPELRDNAPLARLVSKDLDDTGLTHIATLSMTLTAQTLAISRITELGRQFLAFVSGGEEFSKCKAREQREAELRGLLKTSEGIARIREIYEEITRKPTSVAEYPNVLIQDILAYEYPQ
jgi:hypothetical protein